MRLNNLLLALFISLLVSACGGATADVQSDAPTEASDPEAGIATDAQDGSEAASSRVDACALLTQAEAEATLGKSTSAGVRGDTAPIFSCSYETVDYDVVQIVVIEYPDGVNALGAFETAIEINNYPEISGLGDRAYDARPIFDLHVLSGRFEVSIDITNPADADAQLEAAIGLAASAIARLPE